MIEEKLREAEYRKQSFGAGQIVHICEPEKGEILGEDTEKYERPKEILMKCLDCSNQHKEKIPEASNETEES